MFLRQNNKKSANTSNRTNFKSQSGSSGPLIKYRCRKCNKVGHKAADCYFKKKVISNSEAGTTDQSLMAEKGKEESALRANQHVETQGWCLDSGCTSHMCNKEEMFSNLEISRNGVKLANEETVQATGKVNINIIANTGKQNIPYTLVNTLHVPGLRTNLLSIAKIVDKDLKVIFNKNGAQVKDNRGNIYIIKLVADRKGDLFYLRGKTNESCHFTSSRKTEVELWHDRLCHTNFRDKYYATAGKSE
jgi:hypothetical protein